MSNAKQPMRSGLIMTAIAFVTLCFSLGATEKANWHRMSGVGGYTAKLKDAAVGVVKSVYDTVKDVDLQGNNDKYERFVLRKEGARYSTLPIRVKGNKVFHPGYTFNGSDEIAGVKFSGFGEYTVVQAEFSSIDDSRNIFLQKKILCVKLPRDNFKSVYNHNILAAQQNQYVKREGRFIIFPNGTHKLMKMYSVAEDGSKTLIYSVFPKQEKRRLNPKYHKGVDGKFVGDDKKELIQRSRLNWNASDRNIKNGAPTWTFPGILDGEYVTGSQSDVNEGPGGTYYTAPISLNLATL